MSSRELRVNLSTEFPILVQRFFVLANAGVLVALALLIWPYLASSFYLYQGSNILDSALREQGLESSDWEVITFVPINLYSNGLEAKLDSSAGYLQRATRWDATNAEAYNTMAKIHYLQGDPLLAIDALSKVNELRPHNPLVHLTLGDIHDGLGFAEEAVAEYERSQMELKGTSVGERAEVNYLKLAHAYLEAGDPNRALPVLQKTMTLDPDNLYALYYLAGILDTMGEGERLLAQGLYEQLQELQIPTWGDKRLYGYLPVLVPQLVDEGIWSPPKATQIVSSLISQPGLIVDLVDDGTWDSDDLFRLIPLVTSRRTLAEAEWLLDYLRKRTPDSSDLYCLQGETYRHGGQSDQALEAFRTAIDHNSFSGNGFGISSAHARIGLILEERGEMEEALAAYQEAIEADGFAGPWEKAGVYYHRGEVFRLIGRDLDDQIGEFQEALELNPRHYWARLRLGQAYYKRYKNLHMAEQEIRLAMEIEPNNKWAYRLLGDIYKRQGEFDRSREMYERVLELDPNDELTRRVLEELR